MLFLSHLLGEVGNFRGMANFGEKCLCLEPGRKMICKGTSASISTAHLLSFNRYVLPMQFKAGGETGSNRSDLFRGLFYKCRRSCIQMTAPEIAALNCERVPAEKTHLVFI